MKRYYRFGTLKDLSDACECMAIDDMQKNRSNTRFAICSEAYHECRIDMPDFEERQIWFEIVLRADEFTYEVSLQGDKAWRSPFSKMAGIEP